MGGLLIVLGAVCLAYGLLGLALRGRTPYHDAETRAIAAFAQARRDTLVRLATPVAVLGVVLIVAGLVIIAVGA